jgi:replicative DNA helicase
MNHSKALEMERHVLGGILARPDLIDRILWLRDVDFYSLAHRRIWASMLAARAKGDPINYDTAAPAEADRKVLVSIDLEIPTAANAEFYAREVLRLSKTRRCLDALKCATQDIEEKGKDSCDVAGDLSFLLEERGAYKRPTAADVAREAFEQIERFQTGTEEAFLKTGFTDLDKYAPARDELVILAARPSVGKTAFASFLADHLAVAGLTPLFESLEMSNAAVYQRRLCARSRVQMRALRTKGGLTANEWGIVTTHAGAMQQYPVIPGSARGLGELLAEIRQVKAESDIKAVFIDYLQLIDCPEGENRNQEVGAITTALARLSKELKITIFALSQLSRKVEGRSDKRPVLSDLRDSGSIEQDADCVWFLDRPDFSKHPISVLIAKNRNGAIGDVTLQFDPSTGRFYDEPSGTYEDAAMRRCGND